MDEYAHVHHHNLDDAAQRVHHLQKVSILPLVFLIYHEVSGGAFGAEDSVRAAGPLLAILGFLVFPFIWSIPEALITAEMGMMFSENGGYVVWVSSAFGPYWGFQQGWMKWISGVIDNALYPVLFLDYLKAVILALGGGLPRTFAVLSLTAALTCMNYRGLTIVGHVAISLGVFSILPFIIMGLMAIPKLRLERCILAGEVDNPKESLPKALFYTAILVILANLFPLLIGTGAVGLHRESWTDGYFSIIAKIVGGLWLTWLMQVAAAASNMGMFVAKMSSYSYQLLRMAEWGMLHEIFSMRSHHGTPIIGILFSTSSVLLPSWMSFQEIIAAKNILYCFGMLLEFLAFIRIRIKYPMVTRPFKKPLGISGSVLMLVPPTLLILVELAFASPKIMVISLFVVIIGLVLQPCLKLVEKKQWLKFSKSPEIPDFRATEHKNAIESSDGGGRSLTVEELELLLISRNLYPLID